MEIKDRVKNNENNNKKHDESEEQIFDNIYEEKKPDLNKSLNIAFIGKVSTGKSSLINAIMLRERGNLIANVGSTSGVTTETKVFKLDDQVTIIDTPGLSDNKNENSEETKKILKNIDIGIMVVTDSDDIDQKKNYEQLKKHASKTFVVLNKIDIWDELEDSALNDVINDWKKVLDTDQIYPTCTKGYDPKTKKDAPMDTRGVKELRDAIWGYLRKEGKDLLLARHSGDKRDYATSIIATALLAVAGEAFIPGSAAYITATQVIAITSLYYLYTGNILNKASALAILPAFMGESVGITIFLWAKSILPPTGVVDIVAAGVAVSITAAMLAAITYLLSNGYELKEKEILKEKFNEYKVSSSKNFSKSIISTIKEGGNIKDIVYRFLFS